MDATGSHARGADDRPDRRSDHAASSHSGLIWHRIWEEMLLDGDWDWIVELDQYERGLV